MKWIENPEYSKAEEELVIRDKRGIPPTPSQKLSFLAAEVSLLEKRAETLLSLAGEIIATLRVNRLRGTLTSADDAQFDSMIESWSKQLLEEPIPEPEHALETLLPPKPYQDSGDANS